MRLLPPTEDSLLQKPIAELWAAVALPQWALEVLTTESKPAVCSVEKVGRVLVHVANDAAQADGVVAGMAVSAAQVLCPSVIRCARQSALESEALECLAQSLYRFSGLVHIADQGEQLCPVLLLELKGSLALFGGLAALLDQLRGAIQQHSRCFYLAVAPTPSAAKLLALAGDEQPLLHNSQLAGRLAQLPLQHMQSIDAKWLQRLEKLGLETFGELLRLPQAGLRKRFGESFVHYLQQLQGQTPELLSAWQPPQSYETNQNLMDELSDSSQLLPALSEMLGELCDWLQQRSARIQGFEFALLGHRHCICRIAVNFLRPSNRLDNMQKLLALRLEQAVLSSPVVALSLSAKQLIYPKAMQLGQHSLWAGETAASDSWWETLESIQTKLGQQAVKGLECRDEHRPEQAWQWVLPSEEAPCYSDKPVPHERPLWLYEQPQRLNNSEQKQLQLCSRPERIASGWWDQDAVYRDYFIAQLNGRKLWVFRDVSAEQAAWYCHGAFH